MLEKSNVIRDLNITKKNSVILGLFLSSLMITKIITSIIPIENTIVFIIGLLLVSSYFINKCLRITISFIVINVVFIMACLWAIMINHGGDSYIVFYLQNFFLLGSAGMLLYKEDVDHKIMHYTICGVFSVFTLFTIFKYIPEAASLHYVDYSMDVSYTMIVGVASGIFVWNEANKKIKIIIVSTILVSLYYLMFLSDCRGAVLTILCLICVKFFSDRKHKVIWVIFFLGIALLFLFGWDSILEWLVEQNSEMRWLNRLRLGKDDITSGRNELYYTAIGLIKDKPFVGNGVGLFEKLNDGQYTHNIFLQFLVEYGIFIGMFFSLIVIYYIIKCLMCKRKDSLDLFLICQFIPRLFLSSVYWLNPFFWLFVYKQMLLIGKKEENLNLES